MNRNIYILIGIYILLLVSIIFIKIFDEEIDTIDLVINSPPLIQTIYEIPEEESILPSIKEEIITIPARNEVIDIPSRGIPGETMTATYYTWTGYRTASCTWPQEGRTVAVDPEIIPLGSQLVIDGVGGYVAEDTGGLIQSNKIDIYKSSEDECLRLGIRTVTVQIVN